MPRQARVVRRLVTLAAGVTGVVVAHVVGYALAFTDPRQRVRVLHDTGHGYFSIAAWAALAAGGLALAIVAARGAGHDQGVSDGDRPLRVVPSLGTLTAWQAFLFLAVEVGERLAAGAPLHEMARGHEVTIGLAVQVAVAAAVILVLRATAVVSARLAAALRHDPASTRRGRLSSRAPTGPAARASPDDGPVASAAAPAPHRHLLTTAVRGRAVSPCSPSQPRSPMRRLVLGGFFVGALLLGQIGPAAAHEEINPSTFPTGKPVFFTLDAANEATADLVKITLTAPSTVAFGATTRSPAGWTVNRTDQVITWSGGAVKPDHFEQWGFEIEGADQPGTLTYKATLGYADGKNDDVTVDVTAVATGIGSTASAKSSGSSSRADAALVVGVAALALAVAALVLTSRRARPATAVATAAGSPVEQDW